MNESEIKLRKSQHEETENNSTILRCIYDKVSQTPLWAKLVIVLLVMLNAAIVFIVFEVKEGNSIVITNFENEVDTLQHENKKLRNEKRSLKSTQTAMIAFIQDDPSIMIRRSVDPRDVRPNVMRHMTERLDSKPNIAKHLRSATHTATKICKYDY